MSSFIRTTIVWRCVAAYLLLAPLLTTLHAQTPIRIAQPISDSDAVPLANTMVLFARPQNDAGRLANGAPMQRILLTLTPSDDQKASLAKLLDSQHDPASPNYKQWLTPHDYGAQFGPSDADIQQISAGRQGHGFQVNYIAEGGQWIELSGTAGQVEAAFHTEMPQYNLNGKLYTANATNIWLPQALTPLVGEVLSLNNFEKPVIVRVKQGQDGRPAYSTLGP